MNLIGNSVRNSERDDSNSDILQHYSPLEHKRPRMKQQEKKISTGFSILICEIEGDFKRRMI